MTSNDSLFERAKHAIPGGVDSPVRAYGSVGGTPRFYAEASGPFVRDVEGTRYVDLVCSWGPALLGHAHPEVVAAVKEAAARGLSFGAPTLAEVELAEAITERVPLCERVRLVSTGTEATMTAIRLTRGVTGRDVLVKFAGCYHGHSDSLLAEAGSGIATAGLPGSAGVPEAIAAQTLVVPYNDEAALRALFAERGHEIAAVITEAAPANMGVVPPLPGFNAFLREITAEHGALLILDEVLTGFRVGPAGWWGLEQAAAAEGTAGTAESADGTAESTAGTAESTAGNAEDAGGSEWAPDIVTFGKVVGGGMPLAALGGPAAIMDELAPLGPVYQAGTLSGNPLATAAGLATLRLADQGVYDHVDRAAVRIRGALGEALADAGVPFTINHAGSLFSAFIGEGPAADGVENYADAKAQDAAAYGRFFHAMLKAGVALPPSCYEAWFLSAAHDEAALSHIEEAIRTAVRAI